MSTKFQSRVRRELHNFEIKMRRRSLDTSHRIAESCLKLFYFAVDKASDLIEAKKAISYISSQLTMLFPRDILIVNICRLIEGGIEENEIQEISKASNDSISPREKLNLKANHSSSLNNIQNIMNPKNSEKSQNSNERNRHFYMTDENENTRGQSRSFLDIFTRGITDMSSETSNLHPIRIGPRSESSENLIVSSDSLGDIMSSEKLRIKDSITEFINQLSTSYLNIAQYSSEFLFSGDVVLTCGYSKTVLEFLSKAKRTTSSKDSQLVIFVLEHAPKYDGIEMVQQLKERHIGKVILISDASIFAIMPKISKVILSAHIVLENGGFIGSSLTNAIALAAKHHSTPMIVLYWSLKLSDKMPRPFDSFTSLLTPLQVSKATEQKSDSPCLLQTPISTNLQHKLTTLPSNIVVLNAEGDYIGPEYVSLYISDDGPISPVDVYSSVQSAYNYQ